LVSKAEIGQRAISNLLIRFNDRVFLIGMICFIM